MSVAVANSGLLEVDLLKASPVRKLFQRRLISWFGKHARDLPWRRTKDPYAILVSEAMLQQTQAATVIPYFERWMQHFPTVESLAAAEEQQVLRLWAGLGYYARARNLLKTARSIAREHGGVVPSTVAGLRNLPGIGPYTAGAIAAFAFDLPAPALDANVIRVTSRLVDLQSPVDTASGRQSLEDFLQALLPKKGSGAVVAALMELGALLCLPRTPGCGSCPVRDFCRATEPAKLPRKRPRPETIEISENCAFILKDGRVLLEQRTEKKWKGLWTLPRAEKEGGRLLLSLTYPFTRHKVTLRVYAGHVARKLPPAGRWIAAVEEVPMPAPHRRALVRLLADHREGVAKLKVPRAPGK